MYKRLSDGVPRYRIADGCFAFAAAAGTYKVGARAPGFRISTTEVVTGPGTENFVEIALPIGGCTECVTLPNGNYLNVL
jgi:hypothetical protein